VPEIARDLAEACELALEGLATGALVVESTGTILLVNREVERQFGYSSVELAGQSVDLLVPDAVHALHFGPDLAAEQGIAGAAETGHRLLGRRKDGIEIPVQISLHLAETAKGPMLVASIVEAAGRRRVDIAERDRLEQELVFERFVAELSAQFINLPAGQIDDAIRNGLQRTCELFDLDRSTFLRIAPDGTLLAPLTWAPPGVPAIDASTTVRERFPWMIERLMAGQIISFASRDELPSAIDRETYAELQTESSVNLPLSVEGRITGVLAFCSVRAPRSWPPGVLGKLTVIASVFAQVVARQQRDEALGIASEEARRLKEQLQVENVYLRQEARDRLAPTGIVGQSAALRQVLAQIEKVAATDSTVLLLGETGTGKELLATQVHALGTRHARPMVRVNCAAIPPTLIESELFGREKGAFTGALARQVGRFELADHSSIFLDEIGDLPLDVQVKLLRVLEERKFERLGSPRSISVDTRIIAATHHNLEQRIAAGAFREDLYYRLNVFPIHVPALRDRAEDIPLLVWRLVEEFSRAFGKRIDVIDKETLAALQRYSWPGNIRELRNVVERAMIVATGRRLLIPLPHAPAAASRRGPKLVDVEKEHIRAVLESAAWRIRGTGGAADRLGMKPTTLETRMAKLGLKRPGHE
jgi:PAS domain S-box-containing protein